MRKALLIVVVGILSIGGFLAGCHMSGPSARSNQDADNAAHIEPAMIYQDDQLAEQHARGEAELKRAELDDAAAETTADELLARETALLSDANEDGGDTVVWSRSEAGDDLAVSDELDEDVLAMAPAEEAETGESTDNAIADADTIPAEIDIDLSDTQTADADLDREKALLDLVTESGEALAAHSEPAEKSEEVNASDPVEALLAMPVDGEAEAKESGSWQVEKSRDTQTVNDIEIPGIPEFLSEGTMVEADGDATDAAIASTETDTAKPVSADEDLLSMIEEATQDETEVAESDTDEVDDLLDDLIVADVVGDDDDDDADAPEATAEEGAEETATDAGEAEVAEGDAAKDEQINAEPIGPASEEQSKVDEILARERIEQQARETEAQKRFEVGLNLFAQRLYSEALEAFQETTGINPSHDKARDYARRCRQLLGRPTGKGDAELIDALVQTANNQKAELEMRMANGLTEAEKIYLRATNLDEARKALPRMDQIARSLIDFETALQQLGESKTLMGTSVLPQETIKAYRLRADGLEKQILASRKALTEERDRLAVELAANEALDSKKHSDTAHKKIVATMMETAQYRIDHKQYKKAIDLIEKVLVMEPGNGDAMALREDTRKKLHEYNETTNERDQHAAVIQWKQDVDQQHVIPDGNLIYPEDWEQIKLRVRASRTIEPLGAAEQAIRNKLEGIPVTREYREMPIIDVLREIQTISGVNVVAATEVDREMRVDLNIRNMNLLQMLDWLMEIKELSYRIERQVIHVRPRGASLDQVKLELYPVADLTRPYRNYFAPSIEDDDDDDYEDDMEDVEMEPLAEVIPRLVSPETWEDERVSIDTWEDNLMVMQTPAVHAQIVAYLDKLRSASKQQVMVEGRFLEVTDDFLESIGIQWGYDQYVNGDGGKQLNSSMQIVPGVGAVPSSADVSYAYPQVGYDNIAAGTYTYSSGLHTLFSKASLSTGNLMNSIAEPTAFVQDVMGFQVNAVVDAVSQLRQGSVLHNPKLLVANGKNAYVVVRTTTNYVGNWTLQNANFQPEISQYNEGVTWDVRPVISFDRKYITVRVRPKIEQLMNDPTNYQQIAVTQTVTTGDVNVIGTWMLRIFLPQIRTIDIESNATVPDGGTVLVGGEIHDVRNESITGIPLLSSLPVVGRLFRQESRTRDGENRVIMLNAKIVELDE